ncbi:hypothetical protein WG947_07285 [Pontibacter sp. H259]|uniref:hypothetical protein n=1 Tax=Pontibacter sp. H259 TaxID=3133421 RepID=UPI0030C1710F
MKNYLLFILRFCLILLSVGCSSTKTVNCPPEFTIYKNVNKAYPVYAEEFELKLQNTLSTANKLEDTASVTLKSKVVKLRQDLNNISSRVEMLTKSNLMAYFSGICDEAVRARFSEFQNKLADLTLQITKIEAKIGPSKSSGEDIDKKVDEALEITSSISQDIQ